MGRAARSFAEHYLNSAYAAFPQEHRAGGTGPVTILSVAQNSHDFVDPPLPEVVVSVARGGDLTFSWDIGDGWTTPQRVRGGAVHLLPAQTQARLRCDGAHDMIFVTVPSARVETVLGQTGSRLEDLYRNNTDYFADAALAGIAEDLWKEASGASPAARMKTDGLLLGLLGGLLTHAEAPVKTSAVGLGARELAHVRDVIEDGLHRSIGIEDLADAVSLSRFQFARSFKTATGQSPHQYVIARRIARARDLLANSDKSLVEIAYACGFASQSHMTDVFRAQTGVTPGRYRAGRWA